MLFRCLVVIAFATSGALAASEQVTLPTRIRDDNRETREKAFRELHKRLMRENADAETIEAFVLAGLETDHMLRMEADVLTGLVPVLALPHLRLFLSDPRAPVRAQAAYGLGTIGPAAATAQVTLLNCHRSDDDSVADAAGAAISKIDLNGSSFPELLDMLRHADRNVRLRASHALDHFHDRVRPLVAEVLPLVRLGDETERYWLVNVIANTKSTEPTVVRTLAALLLDDPSAFVRERCAREFWEFVQTGVPIPEFVLNALEQAANSDPVEGVRREASKALARSRSTSSSRCERSGR